MQQDNIKHDQSVMGKTGDGEEVAVPFQVHEVLARGSQKQDSFDSLAVRAIGHTFEIPAGSASLGMDYSIKGENGRTFNWLVSIPEQPPLSIPFDEKKSHQEMENLVAYTYFTREWKIIDAILRETVENGPNQNLLPPEAYELMPFKPFFETSQMFLRSISSPSKQAEIMRANLIDMVVRMDKESGYLSAHEKAFKVEGKDYIPPTVSVIIPYNSLMHRFLFLGESIELDLGDDRKITAIFHPAPLSSSRTTVDYEDYFVFFHPGDQEDKKLQAVFQLGQFARRQPTAVVIGENPNKRAVCQIGATFFSPNTVLWHFRVDCRL